jgi:hypothetical protein
MRVGGVVHVPCPVKARGRDRALVHRSLGLVLSLGPQ